jgi:hypothetical protein
MRFRRILSRRARRGAENEALFSKFLSSTMLFFIFIMKINMKEESSFLITISPLRPLRLCVIKFIEIPFMPIMFGEGA